jgi:amino-acid N-acetyltransferase
MPVRRATAADRPALERLLEECELTTHALPEWIDRFWVAEQDGELAGAAGIELYADGCLLRSVAVRPAWRGTGMGRELVERALESAREAGARQAYLLTLTAERWFPRLGFTTIERDDVPASVRESGEFREACPASAIVMTRPLAAGSLASEARAG